MSLNPDESIFDDDTTDPDRDDADGWLGCLFGIFIIAIVAFIAVMRPSK